MSIILKQVSINGSLYYPTSVKTERKKVGDELVALDGTLRFYHRKLRREVTLTWNNVPETTVTVIDTIAALTTSFTFIDELGVSYTVINDGLEREWDAKGIAKNGDVYFKQVSLKVREV